MSITADTSGGAQRRIAHLEGFLFLEFESFVQNRVSNGHSKVVGREDILANPPRLNLLSDCGSPPEGTKLSL